jgi:hypothetical protein
MPRFARISRQKRLICAVVEFLQRYGLPMVLTFDRDPRWVGSASGRDFPSAFVRFLLCLGILPNICPPHRPDTNCYSGTTASHLQGRVRGFCIDRQRSSRCVRSPTRSGSTTTQSDPIKDAPVTMCRLASPFQPCRSYPPFPSRWIQTTGSKASMDALLLAPCAQMAP